MDRVKVVCVDCGSDDVCADAVARWDEDRQEWTVSTLFDEAYSCCVCMRECDIKKIPIA